jgi:hypothetical protein
MSNFTSAFGHRFFFAPVVATAASQAVAGGVGSGSGVFLSTASLVAADAEVTDGDAADQILLAGENIVRGAKNVAGSSTIAVDTVFELEGLTSGDLDTATKMDEVVTYGDAGGWAQGVATSKSWKVQLEAVTDFNHAAYKAMRLAELNNVPGKIRVKFGRVTPSGETIYGYCTLQNFKEKSKAGTIVGYTVELVGYGLLGVTLAD